MIGFFVLMLSHFAFEQRSHCNLPKLLCTDVADGPVKGSEHTSFRPTLGPKTGTNPEPLFVHIRFDLVSRAVMFTSTLS